MKKYISRKDILFTGLVALLVFLSIAVAVEHYLRVSSETHQTGLARHINELEVVSRQLFNKPYLWYGTVAFVSVSDRHITVKFEDKFTQDPRVIELRVLVGAETNIVRQTLTAKDGIYTGYSLEEVIDLSDIRPGERVAAVLRTNETGETVADALIVGGVI